MRRLLLLVGLAWSCGIGGLYLGAALTPEGSGLAGPAEVFLYGVSGIVFGLVAGALLAWRLPATGLRVASAVVGVLAGAAAAALALSVVRARDRAANAAEAGDTEIAFTTAIERPAADDGSTFVRIDVDGAQGTFRMISRRQTGQPACTGTVSASERAALQRTLQTLDAASAAGPLCAPEDRTVMSVSWQLPASGVERRLDVGSVCVSQVPQFEALYVTLENMAFGAESRPGALSCGDR